MLPPEHNLPFYQHRDPSYDAYAEELLAWLSPREVTLVDVGANVGDTAVAALSSGSHVRVRSVEGHPPFVSYLRRNVSQFGSRAEVVDRFVGPVAGMNGFAEGNGTGHLTADSGLSGSAPHRWVTPGELLVGIDTDIVIWKSDLDGLDIHVLVEHWQTIVTRCSVLWFEFDPQAMLGDPGDLERLVELISSSGLSLRIYDNLGRPMVRVPAGRPAADALLDLADWLEQQRWGHVSTPYCDVWAVTEDLKGLLAVKHELR